MMADYLYVGVIIIFSTLGYLATFTWLIGKKKRNLRKKALERLNNIEPTDMSDADEKLRKISHVCALLRKRRHLERDLENSTVFFMFSGLLFVCSWYFSNAITSATFVLAFHTSAFASFIAGFYYTVLIIVRT